MPTKMPKTLLYAFKPFGPLSTNPSQELLAQLPNATHLHKRVFEVEFNVQMFQEAFAEIKPELIIGFGVYSRPRARKLRIERVAHNGRHAARAEAPTPIDSTPGVSLKQYASCKLPVLNGCRVNYHAGYYVCNFSMWQAAIWCQAQQIPGSCRWAFVHVPLNIGAAELLQQTTALLQRIKVL